MNTQHDHLTCLYCDEVLPLKATFCHLCNEYKGVVTVEEWEDYMAVPYYCSCEIWED